MVAVDVTVPPALVWYSIVLLMSLLSHQRLLGLRFGFPDPNGYPSTWQSIKAHPSRLSGLAPALRVVCNDKMGRKDAGREPKHGCIVLLPTCLFQKGIPVVVRGGIVSVVVCTVRWRAVDVRVLPALLVVVTVAVQTTAGEVVYGGRVRVVVPETWNGGQMILHGVAHVTVGLPWL